MSQPGRGPLTRRGRLYRLVGALAVVVFLAGTIPGGIGVWYCDIPFVDLAQWVLYAEFALAAVAIAIRGGMTKPHPR